MGVDALFNTAKSSFRAFVDAFAYTAARVGWEVTSLAALEGRDVRCKLTLKVRQRCVHAVEGKGRL